jgi:hypothetical protein
MMRRLSLFSAHVTLATWLFGLPVLGAELKDLSGCGCAAQSGSTCDDCATTAAPACGTPARLACAAPGCDSLACDPGINKAVAAVCDAACDAPSCGTGCDCLQCCNRWSVLAEAMFLRRSDSGSVTLVRNQETAESLLNANELEFDHTAVPRLQLMRETCSCWGWDISYFGTDSWSTSGSGGGEVSPVLVGPGFDFGSTMDGTVFQVDSSTELHSAEFNVRRRCHECVTLVAGFRWFELSDELVAQSTAPSVLEFFSVDADNHLYGFQVGFDAVLLQPTARFRVDSIVRVGLLGNNADQTTRAPILTGVAGFVDEISTEGESTSFMAELGLRGVVQLTPGLSVIGGYQLLWLDGLALAPEQIPVTNLTAPGSAVLDDHGELFFHGATVGLQLTF